MAKSKTLTDAQTRALAALYLLTLEFPVDGASFRRYDIGSKSRGTNQGYPVKTMRSLQKKGLVRPEHELAVKLYEDGICSCGCDRWIITEQGFSLCQKMNIVEAKGGWNNVGGF